MNRTFAPYFSRVPAPLFVLCAVVSVQFGAALARPLFAIVGEAGTVFLRLLFAALILGLFFRPNLGLIYRQQPRIVALFALAMAASTVCFYIAVARIPLGIAIAIEFIGPLGVAVLNSRSWRDRLWVLIAAVSIALFVPDIGVSLDVWGVIAALCAAFFWGMYIIVSQRAGQVLPGFDGLVAGVILAALMMSIPGVMQGGWALLRLDVLWQSVVMAIAAAIIPFSFEYYALTRMHARTYGILVCTEPLAGAIIGWLLLNEALNDRAIMAIIGITIASLGSTLTSKESHA
ncbi:MAG: EamA family transporter [Roseiflexaceae bacterium]|jgi:inner membrane transporter RhtA|nr:EamA family transporter [Chloroflexaceae bacterium]MCE2851548.1 EamA family transporter [Chloroflexaceae bacterium]